MAIHFHTVPPLRYRISQKRLLKKWIKEAIVSENYSLNTINIIACTDDYLHKMNVEYLQHDTLTDVITFDNSETPKTVEGDIFISLDRVKENAKKFEVLTAVELRRVMIHGVLHLLGYKDKTKKEKQVIRSKENFYLSQFPPS